jgi:hypothetical protein
VVREGSSTGERQLPQSSSSSSNSVSNIGQQCWPFCRHVEVKPETTARRCRERHASHSAANC